MFFAMEEISDVFGAVEPGKDPFSLFFSIHILSDVGVSKKLVSFRLGISPMPMHFSLGKLTDGFGAIEPDIGSLPVFHSVVEGS